MSLLRLLCGLATGFVIRDIQKNSYLERTISLNTVMSKIGEHLNVILDAEAHEIIDAGIDLEASLVEYFTAKKTATARQKSMECAFARMLFVRNHIFPKRHRYYIM